MLISILIIIKNKSDNKSTQLRFLFKQLTLILLVDITVVSCLVAHTHIQVKLMAAGIVAWKIVMWYGVYLVVWQILMKSPS